MDRLGTGAGGSARSPSTALALTAALSVGSAGAQEHQGAHAKATTNLTMWFWGKDDAPGANKWLATAVKSYEAKNPWIKIKVVTQPVATFIATFQAAAAAKSGPDIAAQWATGPILTQVWGGAITAISDLVPKSETKNWLNTSENTYAGKIWAMPLYLIGIPWVYNKALMKQAGITTTRPRSGARSSRTARPCARRTSCRSRSATTPTGRRS